MFISAVLALTRGFTREVLSLLSWVGGALAAYFLYPVLKATARSYFPPDEKLVADVVLVVAIFLVVLIAIMLLTMRVSDWILDSGIGVLDRTLGFLFGLARGLLLVVVAYLFFVWWVPPENHPPGIKFAQSICFVDSTADVIIGNLPAEIAEALADKTQSHCGDPNSDQPNETNQSNEGDPQNDTSLQESYDGGERSSLNQLFQSTQGNQN